jgi:hypothetical protein
VKLADRTRRAAANLAAAMQRAATALEVLAVATRVPTGRPYVDQSTDARMERRAVRAGRLRRGQVPGSIWTTS